MQIIKLYTREIDKIWKTPDKVFGYGILKSLLRHIYEHFSLNKHYNATDRQTHTFLTPLF